MLDKILDKLEPLKAKICKFHSRKKIERQKKIEKLMTFLKDNLADVLGFGGIVVFVVNSSTININFGMYTLSVVLLIMGYIASQRRWKLGDELFI